MPKTLEIRIRQLRTSSGIAFPEAPLLPSDHGMVAMVIDTAQCSGLRFFVGRGERPDLAQAHAAGDMSTCNAGEVVALDPDLAVYVAVVTKGAQRVGAGATCDGIRIGIRFYGPGECPDTARPQFLNGDLVQEFDTSGTLAPGASVTILSGIMDDIDSVVGVPLWCECVLTGGALIVSGTNDFPVELNLMGHSAEAASHETDKTVGLFPGSMKTSRSVFALPSYLPADPATYAWSLVAHNPAGSVAGAKAYGVRCRVFAGPCPGEVYGQPFVSAVVPWVSAEVTTNIFFSFSLRGGGSSKASILTRITNSDSVAALSARFAFYVPTTEGGPEVTGATIAVPAAQTSSPAVVPYSPWLMFRAKYSATPTDATGTVQVHVNFA